MPDESQETPGIGHRRRSRLPPSMYASVARVTSQIAGAFVAPH